MFSYIWDYLNKTKTSLSELVMKKCEFLICSIGINRFSYLFVNTSYLLLITLTTGSESSPIISDNVSFTLTVVGRPNLMSS